MLGRLVRSRQGSAVFLETRRRESRVADSHLNLDAIYISCQVCDRPLGLDSYYKIKPVLCGYLRTGTRNAALLIRFVCLPSDEVSIRQLTCCADETQRKSPYRAGVRRASVPE